MLHIVNIMKNKVFDSKVMVAKKGMSIAPLQNKDIINYKSAVSRCEVRLYQPVSPSLQKPKLQLGIKIQRPMAKMVSIIRKDLSRGNQTILFPGKAYLHSLYCES